LVKWTFISFSNKSNPTLYH